MEHYSDVVVIIMTGSSLVLDDNGEFPRISIKDKNVIDTAATLFYDITSVVPILDYSGWAFLENKFFRDDILLTKNGKRLMEFIYHSILPEEVKLKEGYKWEKNFLAMTESQRTMLDRVLIS
jgi:hypothetical protein